MKKFLGYAVLVMLTIALTVTASYANGTAFGDTVSNTARVGASNASTITAICIDTFVAAIYGETTTDAINNTFHTNSVVLGGTATIIYKVTNTGNSSDSFLVTIGALQYAGGANTWAQDILDKNGTSKNASFIIGPIPEDGYDTFTVIIVASGNIANAPNGSQAYCTVAVSAYGKILTGRYTGDNGTIYADSNSSTVWTDSAMVSAAVFTLTKVCTGATLYNVLDYPRPGATLWYEITYSNTGSDSGLNVYIYDEIDSAVVLDTVAGGSFSDSWVIRYSIQDTIPVAVYGTNGDWTSTIPADKSTIRWIKWDRAIVGVTEDNKTLCYRVIIK